MTELVLVDALAPERDRIARAAACLRRGGLVAFPTETVYGLGVDALDRDAVRRLFAAKGRPANDPLIVHVSSLDGARPLVASIPPAAVQLAERFWPGPLTLVMRRSALVPDEVTAGLDTVAIRVPGHPVARALIDAADLPVAAPSANLFSRPSPTSAAHVLEDLRDRIDMIVDAGATHVGLESTVLDLTTGVPTVLRPGAVTVAMLREVLQTVAMRDNLPVASDQALPSPGLLSKHYAPRAPFTLYRGEPAPALDRLARDARALSAQGATVVVLAAAEELDALRAHPNATVTCVSIGTRADLGSISQRLYAALREADALGATAILMLDVASSAGLATAIRDRLRRAATRIDEG